MARMASSSNDAPVKSESIRTEARGHVVTTSGTARIIPSTSAVEQFDKSTTRICLPMGDKANAICHWERRETGSLSLTTADVNRPAVRSVRSAILTSQPTARGGLLSLSSDAIRVLLCLSHDEYPSLSANRDDCVVSSWRGGFSLLLVPTVKRPAKAAAKY